jgi:hypothetical protein
MKMISVDQKLSKRVLVRKLQKQKPQPHKYVLGSSPGTGGFSRLETEQDGRMTKNKILCFSEDITETKVTKPNLL